MIKYTNAEKVEVLTPKENQELNQRVANAGAKSYADLPRDDKTALDKQ